MFSSTISNTPVNTNAARETRTLVDHVAASTRSATEGYGNQLGPLLHRLWIQPIARKEAVMMQGRLIEVDLD